MNIKRTLETAKATYDLTGLSKEQFGHLLNSYKRQMYIWHNREIDITDELLNKMEKMADSDTLIL